MSEPEKQSPEEEAPINDKLLIYSKLGLLAVGFLGVLFFVVPWLLHDGTPSWRDFLVDDGIILLALGMFVYGFYMNTKMH